MLHLFKVRNDKLAYDSESQALFFVDELAEAVFSAYIENSAKRPTKAKLTELSERSGFDIHEIEDCCDEVDALIEQKAIFQPPVKISVEQLYPEKPMIKSMCLHLSHDCNLRCKYCFAGQGDYGTGHRSMLALATGKRAIDFLIEASRSRHNLDIDFFGGEPLLNWPVVVELTKYAETEGPKHNKNIRLTLTTNATLLNQEKIDFLNEHMKNVVLSIDGRPETNDRMRPATGGRSSYALVMRNIKKFVAQRGKKEYYVRGTYTHFNTDFSKDVLHFADEGLEQLSMEPVVAPPEVDYSLKLSDLPQIEAEYENLAHEYLRYNEKGSKNPFNFFHFNIDLEGGPCLYKRMKGCGVGSEYCAVTPEGDIYPCHQFVGNDAFIMGNVWDNPPIHNPKLEAAFAEIMVPNKPDCVKCWARYFCSGGCVANAYHDSGSLTGLYRLGCRLQKKRLECALWVQAKKQQEKLRQTANN